MRRMIVDTHVYAFTRPDLPVSDARTAIRMRALQRMHAHHHQPAWYTDDRTPADAQAMGGALVGATPLPDVGFRVDEEHGRVAWTQDGREATKQIMPPALHQAAWPAGMLIGAMDHAGVDVALIHTDHCLAQSVADLGAWVARHPDRLRSMAPVDEWRIPAEPDAVIAELQHAVRVAGLHALKFIPPYAWDAGSPAWDGPAFDAFWAAVEELGIPVFFTLGGHPGQADPLSGYIDELARVRRWLDQHPTLRAGLTHGFPYRELLVGDRLVVPDAIWSVFDADRLFLEVSFPIRVGDRFDHPWREVWPVLREMVERVGADQLMWGTDMPFQDRFCTYRQSRDLIGRYAPLSDAERAAILGGTAARLLGI